MVHGLETLGKLNEEAYAKRSNKPDTYLLSDEIVGIFFDTLVNHPELGDTLDNLTEKDYNKVRRELVNQVQFKLDEEL